MGTLRTLFAISVVLSHSFGYVFIGGRNAVQLFYMTSGFLISYILTEKKAYVTVRSFYINRYLRLYPIYITVASLTLIIYSVVAFGLKEEIDFFSVYQKAPTAANLLLVFSNVTLMLQDWVMFAGVDHGQLVFSTNFKTSAVTLWEGLLVPQAWTLGVELSFYLIAPFVLPRKRVILLLLFASLLLRVYLFQIGLGKQDPWDYRFFPAELALFLLGALSHQFLLPAYRKRFSTYSIKKLSQLSTLLFIFVTLTFWLIPGTEGIKSIALFSAFLPILPLAFVFQSTRTWDKQIGELSYPIYVCHMLVIFIIDFAMKKLGYENAIAAGLLAVLVSICFAIALNSCISSRIEGLRDRFRTSAIHL